ncbi:MAG: exopolysaccharide biosynthesis GT4 family glycosyltransferase EpsE [Phycisphaerales bacterium]
MIRLGYLVPEFPGQTHAFFWREIACLEARGCEVSLVSTRPPPWQIICHSWSREASARTTYLAPIRAPGLWRGVLSLLRGGPIRRLQCFWMLAAAEGLSTKARLRGLGLVLAGAILADLARRGQWTHIHVHSAGDAALVAMFAHALGGPPYSLTLHGHIDHYGPAQREKWTRAAFGIAVTNALRDQLLARVPSLDPARVGVAPMGVDTEAFRRATPYAAPAAGEPWRLVTCGRLHPGKGHDDAITAVATLRDSGISATLHLLGEGPDRPRLETLIAHRDLTDRVRLLGAAPESVVRTELESAHAFILGSHDEAIGVATMEAMAMELPVIVTRVGGVPELVRDGIDGLLVPPRDPSAIADAIRRTLEAPETARMFGCAGSARVRDLFTSRRSADELISRLGTRQSAAPTDNSGR